MKITFEELCEQFPQLRTIRPLSVDRISCDAEGFCSVFWNQYSILKFHVDKVLRKLEMEGDENYDNYRMVIIDYFIEKAGNDWNTANDSGLFNEEITEEEHDEKNRRHNGLIYELQDLQKQEYGR